MSTTDGFPASFYGEPGLLGLLANGISAFLVLLQNFNGARTGIPAQGVEDILAGVHLILIGGVCQLLAGLLSFRKYDHLSGTSFVGYAALWSSYGATRIFLGGSTSPLGNLSSSEDLNATLGIPEWLSPPISQSAIAGLIPYILLSFILAFCSATVNYIMPFVFGAITAALVFEAVGLVGRWALVVSGVLELLILIFAIYGSVALLIKGVSQRYALRGFGTPLFNVLLLGTGNSSNSQSLGQEKKKNTKYAEPMALGFFCDTVSPFIFAFYCFGYVPSFAVGAVWVSIISGAQLLSSYYSYLRQDCYHATKFALHCTFWLVKSWEEFVLSVLMDGRVPAGAREAMVGDWFFLAAAMILCVLSLNMDTLELLHNILFLLLTVSTISQIPLTGYYIFFGVACSLYTALSLYGTFARLVNTIAEKPLILVGPQSVSMDRFLGALSVLRRSVGREAPTGPTASELPDALFYLTNGLAALSAIHSSQPNPAFLHLTVPWVLISGTVVQVYVSRLQVQGGRRFGSVIPQFYAAIWATWTWYRFAGQLLDISVGSAYGFTAGAIAFLVVNVFLMLIAAYVNLVLLILTTVMEVILVCFLLSTIGRLPYQLEIAMLAIFSIICLYGTFASMVNCIMSKNLIPTGPPVFKDGKKKKSEAAPPLPCPVADSRLTSGLLSIAQLLDQSGVCGIPTDTVYALAASCKNPKAIEKIYNIKDRPAEKPVCICISSVEQLVAARPPFSPLLWEFMKNVYPGGISCIVPKGDWLFNLGVGPAYDRVGTKDSIMIRVPDHTVTVHLCEITGPLAITSANPSGEPDSTHHDMVVTRLGQKIQGVLCDGVSNEVVASTVVNCLKIDEGTISILREGCVPAAKVREIFERVKNSML
ncbi:uncharacterized protein si:ch211-153b23.3 [Conger conger]|uniref:uncharacterized protein si:ch211-153b23.3 n=1 Tax=Conger conger TaxID=82655 RepID=UPI002A599958|nr:uncharacterized protein si:ch211-153b23.3 [Conger conger]